MLSSEGSSPRFARPEYRQAMPDLLQGDGARAAPVGDIRLCDWDELFAAVKLRLRALVGERLTVRTLLSAPVRASQVQAGVLECAAALDQLHATLLQELARSGALELQLFDAQSALASARAELAGTQDEGRKARHLAMHDGLTGLPNRRYFSERLDHALAHLESPDITLALFYLDLDDFKQINDQHSHEVGDEVLKVVALRLARVVRSEDMFSRLGGDEFACLRMGPALGRPQLSALAGKLFDAVSAPLSIGALTLQIKPSIGIALYPGDGSSSAALLRSADAAMYDAKRQHCGHAFFDHGG
ncbi:GGDEF domain-containing protein [Paucibacter sp. O1-1]|nr:GGDEF domain-containing protein [Paucibacter sp. O1-1]MDA3827602.1 GGDEF domain-containing protein [Paucibacter sp. O1-1]